MKFLKQFYKDIKKALFKRPYFFITLPIISILLLILIFSIVRQPILQKIVERKISKFNTEYKTKITYTNVSFSGFSKIRFQNIKLKRDNEPVLFMAKKIIIKIDFWKIFFKKLSINDIILYNCVLNIYKNENFNNFSYLLRKKSEKKSTQKVNDYNITIEKIITSLFEKIPKKLKINNLLFNSNIEGYKFSFFVDNLFLKNYHFRTFASIEDNYVKSQLVVEGILDKINENIELKFFSQDKNRVFSQWFKEKKSGLFAFDTLQINLKNIGKSDKKYKIKSCLTFNNLNFHHKRIASDTAIFNYIKFDYQLNFGDDYLEIDSISKVDFNKISFHPYIYFRPKPTKKIIMSVNENKINSQDLFESLPESLFKNFKNIKTKGDLSYFGYFEIDFANIDSLKFESQLIKNDFKIEKMGDVDFKKINSTFVHQVYKKNKLKRTIYIGGEKSNFVSYSSIPGHLKNIILILEDPGFYGHNGFSNKSIKHSLIKNIKERKFVRGGSTISMQLVKNIFLNQNKNITRKIEEALIVWLIETNSLSTKTRMFELYLNIIEWGPGVYGIGEASKFYFNKRPSQLTIEESIFLGIIIPRPNSFSYLFRIDGSFREYIENYYEVIKNRLLERENITLQEFNTIQPKVKITGSAKQFLKFESESYPDNEKLFNIE